MTRHYCDICGKEIPSRDFKLEIRDYKSSYTGSPENWWDICEPCAKSIEKFIEEVKQYEHSLL